MNSLSLGFGDVSHRPNPLPYILHLVEMAEDPTHDKPRVNLLPEDHLRGHAPNGDTMYVPGSRFFPIKNDKEIIGWMWR